MYNHKYKNVIIDGNNFLFRAYHTKRPDKFVNGINTTPIYQFLYMIKSVAEKNKPQQMYLTWDQKKNHGGPNFRKELTAYKQQRVETEEKKEIFTYIEHIQKFMDALGIITIFPYNLEADDVVYFLTDKLKEQDGNTLIISSDKDLLQLVSDKVHVFLPSKDFIVTMDNFETFVGIPPSKFLLYKSILGDVSDNISGLDKYSPVRAKKLAMQFEDQKKFLTEDQKEILDRNMKIMDLTYAKQEFSLDYEKCEDQLNSFEGSTFDDQELIRLFKEYDFSDYRLIIGKWTKLFDTSNKTTSLLSQISL